MLVLTFTIRELDFHKQQQQQQQKQREPVTDGIFFFYNCNIESLNYLIPELSFTILKVDILYKPLFSTEATEGSIWQHRLFLPKQRRLKYLPDALSSPHSPALRFPRPVYPDADILLNQECLTQQSLFISMPITHRSCQRRDAEHTTALISVCLQQYIYSGTVS